MTEAQQSFQRLARIVEELREQCPWDRKQTKESLRHLTIEETFELADAILKNDYAELQTELGDLLLHILFYTSLATQKGKFTLHDMIDAQINKLVRRHPHVYGDLKGASEAEINANWEKIKAAEKALLGKQNPSVLDGVPDSMPSLVKAQRMQEKAASQGFDWEKKEDVWKKFEEELAEFQSAETEEEKAAEMGDMLFSLVNYCRFEGINAEDALARTNVKFKRRFQAVETTANEQGKSLPEMSLQEMDQLWDAAKAEETDPH
ncbi:MAG: nucleoside triphosphate pyrophosphohydrolase [Bacteroidota bacterium]